MTTISVAFDPDGSIEFTRNAELDWLFNGAGEMKRVTDIKKLSSENFYFITWMLGPYAGKHPAQNIDRHDEVFGKSDPVGIAFICNRTGTLFFHTYEAAVRYEIDCLNAMRKAGVTFDG